MTFMHITWKNTVCWELYGGRGEKNIKCQAPTSPYSSSSSSIGGSISSSK